MLNGPDGAYALFNHLPAAIIFAKPFFTMFPNGNTSRITVKQAV